MQGHTKRLFAIFVLILGIFLLASGCGEKPKQFRNSVGQDFVLIPEGSFLMGEGNDIPDEYLVDIEYLTEGDIDEHPVHRVNITESFYMATREVLIEEYQQFRPDYQGVDAYAPYATGISWNEAVAYCEWLSEKEGKNYRLATEAEWEYACRAGTTSLFWSGEQLPDSGAANPWGLLNMHSGPVEWCYDWYALYGSEEVDDPVGAASSFTKVVRGGGLDRETPYYARSANRASMGPAFPPVPLTELHKPTSEQPSDADGNDQDKEVPEGFKSRMAYLQFVREADNNHGNHHIGIRLVQAELPGTEPVEAELPFVRHGVKQSTVDVADKGPDAGTPHFRKRYLLPTPPENLIPPFESGDVSDVEAIAATGFDARILTHNHSAAFEVMPNGDLLLISYTAVSELTPNVAMLATRLRFGADQWDFPEIFIDLADVDDHAPMLWREGNTIRFFWGANKLESGFPFQWITSTDNGASWSNIHFPVFETPIGGHSAQPINTAVRGDDGTFYVASDGIGPQSVLWKTTNDGDTWSDPGGRTGGRHTSFVLLDDGSILGMGGKSSEIGGYMPKSISTDGGKTWKISKTPFPPLGVNQRPSVLRLQSGRLLFAGDFQRNDGYQPPTIKQHGAYVALSEDEGETWHIKKLPGTQDHELPERAEKLGGETIGYSVVRQAPNGLIHLITSTNNPCLHFEMNEAWILSGETLEDKSDSELMAPPPADIASREEHVENYPGGGIKARWSAVETSDGRYLLDGEETWYYENGAKKYQAEYDKGKKTGTETFWSGDGQKRWTKVHKADGISEWTTWYENGQKRSVSTWKNKHATGQAVMWNREGEKIKEFTLENGRPVRE